MLTTVAVLIIVMGLMVSLARYVRDRSAQQLTKNLLHQLDLVMIQYAHDNDRRLPHVTSVIPENVAVPDEPTIQTRARLNNEDFVRALRMQISRTWMRPVSAHSSTAPPGMTGTRAAAQDRERFGELPLSVYDEVTLRDAWGSLIVFMPGDHRAIGMARREWPSFFFSAGPDRQYLTRDDNLYSYESGLVSEN